MFSFLSFWDWILQVIHTVLLKFIFTPISTTTHVSTLPNEIITDILLRLPTKSLLKCMSVSKSWHQLISSPDFVNTHLKLNKHRLVLFPGINSWRYRLCSLAPLFNEQQLTRELLQMDPPCLSAFFVGSANGLICLFNLKRETYIWNPTISKSKKLLYPPLVTSRYTKYGFVYDDSRDDYRAVFINYCSSHDDRTLVNVYSLRTDSWTTLQGHDKLQGIFLLNDSGKFVNGKLYWAASTRIGNYDDVHNIISFDVADETWGSLELPICGKDDNATIKLLGVVGSDLSMLYTCHRGPATFDVWILKDCSVSWMKLFTIEYPLYHFCSPILTFSIHLCQSNKGDISLSLPGLIMIFDGSTKKLKQTAAVRGCHPAVPYVESIVNPLTVSG